MKKLLPAVIVTLVSFSSSFAIQAASVEVEWKNPEKYRDVKPTNQSRKKFREHTFGKLEEHIVELASELPEDHKLTMSVSNLDLAGQVWPASFVGFSRAGSEVRLVKQTGIPRMTFSYSLLDKEGQTVKSAEVKLKDMTFLSRHNRYFSNETFRYEKKMIDDWFEKEFISESRQ